MFPFAATVATPQPNVPSPGPWRTVTITLQADAPVCGERSAQHAETILTGPPAMLYLCIHVLPNAVQGDGDDLCATGVRLRSAAAEVVDPHPGASRQSTAGMSQNCRTDLIVQFPPRGGK
jgi:hypothetical protein